MPPLNTYLDEFRQLGCDDVIKCSIAYKAYELSKKYLKNHDLLNLEKHYDTKIKAFYFRNHIKDEKDKPVKIILPIMETQSIDFTKVECLQNDNVNDAITLAILDSSSNVVYNTVKKGFVDKESNYAA